jgi:hypothetical protein
MDNKNSERIDRIKEILELDTDKELADLCETLHPRISVWRHKGFAGTVERLLDALMDKYDQDRRPKRKRKPNRNLPVGQRIREARRRRKMTQKELGMVMYAGEGINTNTLKLRVSRMEKKLEIDAETMGLVAKALEMSVDEI